MRQYQKLMSSVGSAFDEAHATKCELAAEVLRSSGRLRLCVTGWSMLPAVWPGDTLLINRSAADQVSEGDLVLLERNRRFFVHRIVKKSGKESQVLTRGDANPQPDPPFTDNELLGKVSLILRNNNDTCVVPRPRLRLPARVISALVQRSVMAARIIVSLRELLQNLRPVSLIPN
jgi:signal peptidase I